MRVIKSQFHRPFHTNRCYCHVHYTTTITLLGSRFYPAASTGPLIINVLKKKVFKPFVGFRGEHIVIPLLIPPNAHEEVPEVLGFLREVA